LFKKALEVGARVADKKRTDSPFLFVESSNKFFNALVFKKLKMNWAEI
jgi:hypothetical protein